jgi:hypothetical protein
MLGYLLLEFSVVEFPVVLAQLVVLLAQLKQTSCRVPVQPTPWLGLLL